MYSVLIFAGLAAFVGSQLFGINSWHEATLNWRRLLVPGQSHAGGSSLQALLFFIPLSGALIRVYAIPCWRSLDVFAPGIALASAIARLGCFAAGCCWGKPTNSWIGVHFTHGAHELTGVPLGEALVPTQLLLSGASFLILGLLFVLRWRKKFDGQIILAFAMLYSVMCFTIGFWRDEPAGRLFGLSTSQLISAITLPAVLLICLCQLKRHSPHAGALVQPNTLEIA